MSVIKSVVQTPFSEFDATFFSDYLSSGYYNHFDGIEEFFVEDFANVLSNKYSPVDGVIDDRDGDYITSYDEGDEHPYNLTQLFDAFLADKAAADADENIPLDYDNLDEIFDPYTLPSSGSMTMHLGSDDFLAGSDNDGKNRNEVESFRYLEAERQYLFNFDFSISFHNEVDPSTSAEWLSIMQIHQARENESWTLPAVMLRLSRADVNHDSNEMSVVVGGNNGTTYAREEYLPSAEFIVVDGARYTVNIGLEFGATPGGSRLDVQILNGSSVVYELSYEDENIGYYDHSTDKLMADAFFKLGPYRSVPDNEEAISVTYHDLDVFSRAYDAVTENVIAGSPGNDAITIANNRADRFRLDDHVNAYGGDDTVEGGYGDDLINGGTGEDFLYGGLGDDGLIGGDGADTIYGGAGVDQLQGEAGVDYLFGGDGADVLDGGADNDVIRGESGNDTLLGGLGNDILRGGDGSDFVGGQAGGDSLYGEGGNDTLSGDAGNDYLIGGSGSDTFVFSENFDSDIISDFEDDIDTLDLSGFYSSRAQFDAGVSTGEVVIAEPSTSVHLDFQNGDILKLYSMSWSDLSDDLTF